MARVLTIIKLQSIILSNTDWISNPYRSMEEQSRADFSVTKR